MLHLLETHRARATRCPRWPVQRAGLSRFYGSRAWRPNPTLLQLDHGHGSRFRGSRPRAAGPDNLHASVLEPLSTAAGVNIGHRQRSNLGKGVLLQCREKLLRVLGITPFLLVLVVNMRASAASKVMIREASRARSARSLARASRGSRPSASCCLAFLARSRASARLNTCNDPKPIHLSRPSRSYRSSQDRFVAVWTCR